MMLLTKIFDKTLSLTPTSIRKILFWGRGAYCPICESWVRNFWTVDFGAAPRKNARCPVCDSMERHRIYWMLFRKWTNLFDGKDKKVLHIAPEPVLQTRIRELKGVDYLSADFSSKIAMVRMDITKIQYPEDSFDIIICSHVLEHIIDDSRAIAELYRVLKPGGWALLQVPIYRDVTYEDFNVSDPQQRLACFGQHDHVRACGLDYRDRYIKSGFIVKTYSVDVILDDVVSSSVGIRDGMTPVVFICMKETGNK